MSDSCDLSLASLSETQASLAPNVLGWTLSRHQIFQKGKEGTTGTFRGQGSLTSPVNVGVQESRPMTAAMTPGKSTVNGERGLSLTRSLSACHAMPREGLRVGFQRPLITRANQKASSHCKLGLSGSQIWCLLCPRPVMVDSPGL